MQYLPSYFPPFLSFFHLLSSLLNIPAEESRSLEARPCLGPSVSIELLFESLREKNLLNSITRDEWQRERERGWRERCTALRPPKSKRRCEERKEGIEARDGFSTWRRQSRRIQWNIEFLTAGLEYETRRETMGFAFISTRYFLPTRANLASAKQTRRPLPVSSTSPIPNRFIPIRTNRLTKSIPRRAIISSLVLLLFSTRLIFIS